MKTKKLTLLLILGVVTTAVSKAVEPTLKSLNELSISLTTLQREQTHKYRWESVTKNGAATASKNYATLVVSTKSEKNGILLHDTITLIPFFGGTVFERKMKCPTNSLLHPEHITLDITGGGKTVREMSYEKGEMKVVDSPRNTNSLQVKFDEGILTFNTLLRLAPLLPRDVGKVHTFQTYAEPFLFRIRRAEEKGAKGALFTITCETLEKITIGKKSYDCAKFTLELKSVRIKSDLWVAQNGPVVKLVEHLPKGGTRDQADYLEATIQD